jgi:hypothetical protein
MSTLNPDEVEQLIKRVSLIASLLIEERYIDETSMHPPVKEDKDVRIARAAYCLGLLKANLEAWVEGAREGRGAIA